jgi:hypothetical protein
VLGAVQIGKRPRHHVTVREVRRISQGLKQSATDDLNPLLGAGRSPGRLDTPDDIA